MVLTIARQSSSTVLYLDCVGDNEALPHCIRANLSLYTGTSAKSILCSRNASVKTTVVMFGSKGCSIVRDVKAFF